MDGSMWWSAIFDNIGIPILACLGGIIVFVLKSLGDRVTKSIVAKNEAASLEKVFAVKTYVMQEISTVVDAAVASNMQIADDMKRAGQKLTEEQVQQLQESAKTLVVNSLPASLTEENGSMIQVIGGPDKLDALITAMIEKSVYEYKIKKANRNKNDYDVPSTNITTQRKTYTIEPTQFYNRKK